MQCLQRPEDGAGAPGTGVTGGHELPCGCSEASLGPLSRAASALSSAEQSFLQPLPTLLS